MQFAISLQSLTKRYGRVEALRGATFDVGAGEVFGFLGPNGAGKTTTIRLLLDLLRPSSGHAEIFGLDCRYKSREARSKIGYLPGDLALYSDMTGRSLLELLGRLSATPVHESKRQKLLDRMQLSAADLGRRIREYSSGMRRKLGIVQAFQHEPQLLILDEPTDGLDPLMQEAFYELVRDTAAAGVTLFISSHILSEVDRMCARIALLREGEVILVGAVEEVRRLAPRVVRIHFARETKAPPALVPRFALVEAAPLLWTFRVQGEIGELLQAAAGHPIRDIEIETPRLEDVIVGFYRGGQP